MKSSVQSGTRPRGWNGLACELFGGAITSARFFLPQILRKLAVPPCRVCSALKRQWTADNTAVNKDGKC